MFGGEYTQWNIQVFSSAPVPSLSPKFSRPVKHKHRKVRILELKYTTSCLWMKQQQGIYPSLTIPNIFQDSSIHELPHVSSRKNTRNAHQPAQSFSTRISLTGHSRSR